MKREEFINLVMEVNDVTYDESIGMIEMVQERILDCDPFFAEEIVMDELSLEMDYIEDILFF